MAEPPVVISDDESNQSWWAKLIQPFTNSFKNECNIQSIELGMECCLATYVITALAFKKPQAAFKYSMVAFLLVPTINWPLCVTKKKLARDALTPKEL